MIKRTFFCVGVSAALAAFLLATAPVEARPIVVCDQRGCSDSLKVHTGKAKSFSKRSVNTRKHQRRETASRSCLTTQTRAILNRLEARFGHVHVVSTCRKGAVIAGTRHPSQHRYGKAVDLLAPPGKKAAVVAWLVRNAPGVTMTYCGMKHVHFDTGPYHKRAYGGCKTYAKKRVKKRYATATAK